MGNQFSKVNMKSSSGYNNVLWDDYLAKYDVDSKNVTSIYTIK